MSDLDEAWAAYDKALHHLANTIDTVNGDHGWTPVDYVTIIGSRRLDQRDTSAVDVIGRVEQPDYVTDGLLEAGLHKWRQRLCDCGDIDDD
ncbi:hypothetical protein CH289_07810 [Rhodococcus sp. RS1C4]|nr:hypothetical protein [Rhodococcus sp. RS1C4]OZC55088.1 hypothetical protein CH289_07810 [Rhodococcus sp. RS1C4]